MCDVPQLTTTEAPTTEPAAASNGNNIAVCRPKELDLALIHGTLHPSRLALLRQQQLSNAGSGSTDPSPLHPRDRSSGNDSFRLDTARLDSMINAAINTMSTLGSADQRAFLAAGTLDSARAAGRHEWSHSTSPDEAVAHEGLPALDTLQHSGGRVGGAGGAEDAVGGQTRVVQPGGRDVGSESVVQPSDTASPRDQPLAQPLPATKQQQPLASFLPTITKQDTQQNFLPPTASQLQQLHVVTVADPTHLALDVQIKAPMMTNAAKTNQLTNTRYRSGGTVAATATPSSSSASAAGSSSASPGETVRGSGNDGLLLPPTSPNALVPDSGRSGQGGRVADSGDSKRGQGEGDGPGQLERHRGLGLEPNPGSRYQYDQTHQGLETDPDPYPSYQSDVVNMASAYPSMAGVGGSYQLLGMGSVALQQLLDQPAPSPAPAKGSKLGRLESRDGGGARASAVDGGGARVSAVDGRGSRASAATVAAAGFDDAQRMRARRRAIPGQASQAASPAARSVARDSTSLKGPGRPSGIPSLKSSMAGGPAAPPLAVAAPPPAAAASEASSISEAVSGQRYSHAYRHHHVEGSVASASVSVSESGGGACSPAASGHLQRNYMNGLNWEVAAQASASASTQQTAGAAESTLHGRGQRRAQGWGRGGGGERVGPSGEEEEVDEDEVQSAALVGPRRCAQQATASATAAPATAQYSDSTVGEREGAAEEEGEGEEEGDDDESQSSSCGSTVAVGIGSMQPGCHKGGQRQAPAPPPLTLLMGPRGAGPAGAGVRRY